ncbi:MAG: ABC transporter ATP-binding protein [Planctomycetota bacterium]
MIELSDLEFAYSHQEFSLRVDHFRVDAGRQVALIGPSGSGKSTLLNLMAGIFAPHKGSVIVDGRELGSLSSSERSDLRITSIGLVFQSFELLEYLTVLDNLLLPYRLSSSLNLTAEARHRAVELSQRLEISTKLNRYPSQLSQGERQRVAIGRALVTRPVLLLADEPTGNLDPHNKKQVVDLILDNATQQNVALVMVTHDYSLLDRFETLYEVGVSSSDQKWAEVTAVNDSMSVSKP